MIQLSPPWQSSVVLSSAQCYDKLVLLQWRDQIRQSELDVVTVGAKVSPVQSEQDPHLAGSDDVRRCHGR